MTFLLEFVWVNIVSTDKKMVGEGTVPATDRFGRVVGASRRFFEEFLGVDVLFKDGAVTKDNARTDGTDVSIVLVVDTSNSKFIHVADTENDVGIVVVVVSFLDFGR
jgi:hypothetical protein